MVTTLLYLSWSLWLMKNVEPILYVTHCDHTIALALVTMRNATYIVNPISGTSLMQTALLYLHWSTLGD
jgi:hypothetical protein